MKRKSPTSDSLDLLLDTICNTFGGVLFIAMLVIILVNTLGEEAASVAPDAKARQEFSAAQLALAQSQAELDRLRLAASEQAQLARLFADPKLRDLVTQATSKQTTATSAAAAGAANLQSAAQAQQNANQLADSLRALDQALQQAQQRLAIVDQQLAAERQLRTRTVHLPKQKTTAKQQIAYLLKGGRLHAYVRLGPSGAIEPEPRDTQIVTAGGESYLDVVPGGGAIVDPTGDKSGVVAGKIGGWDANQFFIAVAVWPDSFEHFAVVRQILVERGLEYQLMPTPADAKVPLTDAPVSKQVQ